MKTVKLTLIFLILISLTGITYSQKITESENWLKGFNTEADYLPTLAYWSNKFTRSDIDNGKKRLELVRQFSPTNEWEGLYYSNTGLGDSKLLWNAEGGYFQFFFYHELKNLNYGRINDATDFFEMISDNPPFVHKNKKQTAADRIIKIKVGDSHFLVPENRLQEFCESAAGLNDNADFFYYWTKEDDMSKDASELPILSANYAHFLRYPIEVRIVHIGKRKIIPSEFSTKEFNHDDIHYPIILSAGKDEKIKVGMNFFVEDLKEWIQITTVTQKNSVGFIKRDFDENNQEKCWDGRGGFGQIIPCEGIKTGMKARTRSSL